MKRVADRHFKAFGVEVTDETAVECYLASHPGILAAAQTAARLCRQEFGPDARLILSVYSDPEFEDEYLSMELRLRSYDDSVMPVIRKVSKAYESRVSTSKGWFLLTTDFIPSS